jgi:hypothetical protein
MATDQALRDQLSEAAARVQQDLDAGVPTFEVARRAARAFGLLFANAHTQRPSSPEGEEWDET